MYVTDFNLPRRTRGARIAGGFGGLLISQPLISLFSQMRVKILWNVVWYQLRQRILRRKNSRVARLLLAMEYGLMEILGG